MRERIKNLKLIEKTKIKKIKELQPKIEKTLTKAEIIEQIKIKFPNMKNLNSKKKDDLLKILNQEKKIITPSQQKEENNVDISKVIKKLNKIQNLNYDDIVKELEKYNIFLKKNKKYSKSKIEEVLYNAIKRKYLITKKIDNQVKQKIETFTKDEIILKIKDKYPNVKKLSTFKKEKLLDIYTFLF